MGLPLATGLALKSGKPFTVARKRRYGLPGEIVVKQTTGYSESALHVHGLQAGERLLLVDDVLSTGGTLRALAQAARTAGARPLQALLVVSKHPDPEALARELGFPLHILHRIRIQDGRVHLENRTP